MAKYYVNKNTHEVHEDAACPTPADSENRDYLGDFPSCHGAVTEAKSRGYDKANGCANCSPACHTD